MTRKYGRVNFGWFILAIVAGFLISWKAAKAQEIVTNAGDCAGRSSACADLNTVVDVQGATIGGDNHKAVGIGLSSPSFTAAISQCVATEALSLAFGAWGKQKVVANYHCMGLAYLRSGMFNAGEYILCTHTELSHMGEDECKAAVKQFVLPIVTEPEPEPSAELLELEEYHEERLEEQQMLIADMQAKIMNLETELETELAQVPEPVVQQVVVDDGAERRAKARAAAQAVLERAAGNE